MEKIRKGNDIRIHWEIFASKDGGDAPYNLEGKNLTLYLRNAFGKTIVKDFNTSGNVITVTFLGKDQEHTGKYTLTLVENEGLNGMHTIDECDAFELVNCSCKAERDAGSKIEVVTLNLKGTMMIGGSIDVDDHLSLISENPVQNKVVTAELKKKIEKADIPTPDWNAEPREDGYIKNRTHFFEWYAKPEDENFNDLLLGLKDKTPISVTEDGHIKTVKYLANKCSPMWEQGFEYFDKQWESNSYDILDGFVTVLDIFAGNANPKISISCDYDGYDNELIYVTIQWNTEAEESTDDVNEVIDAICSGYYIIPYGNYRITELSSQYIPSSIARTADLNPLYEETEALWENVQSIDEEITKLSEEKVDADKVATINGQSLVNGGNIKIDTTTHEGGLVDGYTRLKFQYDADRGLYEAKLDINDMGKIYQDFRFDGIGGTVRHLHEVDLHKPNNIILDTDGSGNIRYGTLVFIDQESPAQEYVYYQISEEDWYYRIADSFYGSSETTLLPFSEILIPESIARKEYVNERIEDIEVFVEDLYNNTIQKEADDYYPQLSVGVADNLAGVDVVASAFRIRRSGGGAITDGVARVQSIKGNSVVWNQLNTFNYFGYDTADILHVAPIGTRLIKGHKYLFGASEIKEGELCINFIDSDGNDIDVDWTKNYRIWTCPQDLVVGGMIGIWDFAANDETSPWYAKNMIFCDLTLMFGVGNEPTTIKEFYARIPMGIDLNAYNEGEVISMRADGIKSVGVNQWDEEWELGGVDGASGQEYDSTTRIRPVGYIEVLPNAQYYAKKPESKVFYLCFYDANKVFLSQQAITTSGVGGAFTTPKEAYYMRFILADPTYNHDICINLSDADINGQYFPHEEASEDLSFVAKYFPAGLRSAGTAHDEIRYNKQSNKWEAVQRIGSVDLGTLKWTIGNGDNYVNSFYAQNALANKASGHNILCSRYVTNTKEGWPSMTDADKTINSHSGDYKAGIWIHDSSYTDAATLKADLQGVILYYELAEPLVTEIAEPFNLDYKVWNFGTEQMEATEPSSPLSAEITYGFNAIGKIKELESNQGVSKEYVDNAIATAITNELNGDF